VKTFAIYRKVDGKPMDYTIGRWPETTVEQARKVAQEKLGDIAAGLNPQAEKRAIRAETTFGELFAEYLELHAKPRKRSWAEDDRLYCRHMATWKARRLSELSAKDIQTWHSRIGKANGKTEANRAHSLIRKVFNFARGRGWKEGNPAVGVQRFTETSRERFMDADELRVFFSSLQSEPDLTARDFFLVALLTGARRANVLSMCWGDLDLKRALWHIPGERSKNGAPLVIILAPQVVAILVERKPTVLGSPWVFPSDTSKSGHFIEPKFAWSRILARAELGRLVAMIADHKGLSPKAAAAASQEAVNAIEGARFEAFARRLPKGTDPTEHVLETYRAKVSALGLEPSQARMQDLRIHDLRRTLGSWQAASGSSLPIIGRSLGHKQMQTTAIYARLSLDPVRESVERATSAMLAVSDQPDRQLNH